MPRLKRVAPIGVPQHVIQRGNNRQVCFGGDEDMMAYIAWLKEFSPKFEVRVHAWVFMTNHVHLLCTPMADGAVSKMMQSLGRMYERYFNKTYGRSGTLWEGRFKSCLVESERYLLEVHRYIELNPVRAGMVNEPSEYKWSSYQCNALGKQSDLQHKHSLYLRLGATPEERCLSYRNLFATHVTAQLIEDLRKCTNSGTAFGSPMFVGELEALAEGRLSPSKMGRPKR